MERRVEPTLADWQNEYLEAVQQGRHWPSRWIQFAGVLAVFKVVALVTLEQSAHELAHLDADTRRALARVSAIFGAVTTTATAVLAWVPLNAMPVADPIDLQELLLLIPQALPLAIPLGLTAAVLLGLAGRVPTRIVVGTLTWAAICSVMSFLTLGWLAPASNQAYRTKVVGREIAKGDNELTLDELGTRIEQIRAFDPSAPARRLSTLYHVRVALSATPLVLAVFSLVTISRIRGRRGGRVSASLLACGGFTFLFVWTAYLAFRGAVPPPMAAWLPNIVFLGLPAGATLCPRVPAAENAS
jgi:lipopolysaccharide export system permease LptF/LptG-like protein